MTLFLTHCKDKAKWDAFVAASPQGNVFCGTPFLDALGVDYDLLFVEENQQSQLGAVVIKREGRPIQAPYPFTMYQGVLFDGSSVTMPHHKRMKWGLEVVEYMLMEMASIYDRISFCMHYSLDDLRAFQWFHYHDPQLGQFKIDLRYTGLLDLKAVESFEDCLAKMRTVRRQEYRRGLVDGLIIKESSDIGTLNRLHRMTFERQGIERPDEEERLLLAITETALSKGFGRLLVCKDRQGTSVAAMLFLYDARCGYYLFGANHPDFRKSGSGTCLLVENIRRCMEMGLSMVDLVGINSPSRGDYKTSFNAAPFPYYVASWQK